MSGYVDEDEARKIIAELRQRAESAERALAEARQGWIKTMNTTQYIAESGWPQVHGQPSTVTFTVQSGPIKEFGVNGCQIDDVIAWAKSKIEEFNTAFPCRENSLIITKLDEALLWSMQRKLNREKRGVEGQNKA